MEISIPLTREQKRRANYLLLETINCLVEQELAVGKGYQYDFFIDGVVSGVKYILFEVERLIEEEPK